MCRAMTIIHHPDLSTLMTCSAGATPEALCAVVASHLSMCPQCMHVMPRLERIGIALFTFLEPVDMLHRPRDDAPHPLGPTKPTRRPTAPTARVGDIPAPIAERVGRHLDRLPWTFNSDGIWDSPVKLSAAAKGDLRFIRLEPGATLHRHANVGEELTLVLAGEYLDQTSIYGVGDFREVEDGAARALTADKNRGCIILVASENALVAPPEADAHRTDSQRPRAAMSRANR